MRTKSTMATELAISFSFTPFSPFCKSHASVLMAIPLTVPLDAAFSFYGLRPCIRFRFGSITIFIPAGSVTHFYSPKCAFHSPSSHWLHHTLSLPCPSSTNERLLPIFLSSVSGKETFPTITTLILCHRLQNLRMSWNSSNPSSIRRPCPPSKSPTSSPLDSLMRRFPSSCSPVSK